MEKKHGILNYSKITPNIYIGSNMCCQYHFEEELLKNGIDSDISLEADKIDAAFGVKAYLWIPTKDHTAPEQEQLNLGVRMLNTLTKENKKIYVHCKHGHGRAPTLVAAYLIGKGMSVPEAVKFIKSKRPAMHLSKNQISALQKFQKSAKLSRLKKSLFL